MRVQQPVRVFVLRQQFDVLGENLHRVRQLLYVFTQNGVALDSGVAEQRLLDARGAQPRTTQWRLDVGMTHV
jgi:hypothetical protein